MRGVVDEAAAQAPDVRVRGGEPLDRDAVAVAGLVVEVLSASTRGRDTGGKLDAICNRRRCGTVCS